MYLSDYDQMSCILSLAVNKKYLSFIYMILCGAPGYDKLVNYHNWNPFKFNNIVNTCLFIAKDKDKFIKKNYMNLKNLKI